MIAIPFRDDDDDINNSNPAEFFTALQFITWCRPPAYSERAVSKPKALIRLSKPIIPLSRSCFILANWVLENLIGKLYIQSIHLSFWYCLRAMKSEMESTLAGASCILQRQRMRLVLFFLPLFSFCFIPRVLVAEEYKMHSDEIIFSFPPASRFPFLFFFFFS